MKRLGCLFALCLTTPAMAEDAVQDQVLACVQQMDQGTSWSTCLNMMFAPCGDEKVGSETHLTCLADQQVIWQQTKAAVEGEMLESLTQAGTVELSGLMLAWPSFVKHKCKAVAEGRADISFDAAFIGCEISEVMLMTNEFVACTKGLSLEAYCDRKD